MNANPKNRLVIGLSILVIIFATLAAWGWGRAIMHEISAKLADGWTGLLQESRDAALENTNVTEVANSLRWISRFYRPPKPPSGGIDRSHYLLMERVRTSYQRDIIGHLRHLTGDSLGNDPKLWVDKYAARE